MKFRNGYWEIRDGFSQIKPAEFWDAEIRGRELHLFATAKKFNHWGDTLNTPLLTTIISSPMPDIIHVKMFRHKGIKKVPPEFNIIPDLSGHDETGITIGEKDGLWRFTAGKLAGRSMRRGL